MSESSSEDTEKNCKEEVERTGAVWITFAQRLQYQAIIIGWTYLRSHAYRSKSNRHKDFMLTRRSSRALNEAFAIATYLAPLFLLSLNWPHGGANTKTGLRMTARASTLGALLSGVALMPILTSIELLAIALFGLSSHALACVIFGYVAAADACHKDAIARQNVWAALFLAVQVGTATGAIVETQCKKAWILCGVHFFVALIFSLHTTKNNEHYSERTSTITQKTIISSSSDSFEENDDPEKEDFSQVRQIARVFFDASIKRKKILCFAPIASFFLAILGLILSLFGWSQRMIGAASCGTLGLAIFSFISLCAPQAGFLEASKQKHGGNLSDRAVDAAKDICLLCPFIGLTMLLATAYAVTSFLFNAQFNTSERDVNHSFILKSMDTLFTLILLPFIEFFIYPKIETYQAKPLRPVPKFVASGFFFILALISALLISILSKNLNLIKAIPQNFCLGFAVAISGPTFYEIFYTEVPTQLRIVSLATNFFAVLVGILLGPNLITILFPSIYYAPTYSQTARLSLKAVRYSIIAAAAVLSLGLLFWWFRGASTYIHRQDRDWVTLQSSRRRGNSSVGVRPATTILAPTTNQASLLESSPNTSEIVAVVRSIFSDLEANYLIPFSLLKMGKIVASGGSGQVYRGTYAGAPVAIKMVYSQMMDPQYLHDLRHEARMLAAVRHPHITQFHGISRFENRLLLVTEFVPLTLEQVLKKKGPFIPTSSSTQQEIFALKRPEKFSLLDTLRIWIELAHTLIYLHSIRLSHRDLKPSNLLLMEQDESYRLKLCDLGMAHFHTSSAESVPGIGTPAYSPPESGAATLTDAPKWDIFSFATLIWATWHVSSDPFPGLPIHQVTAAVSRGERPTFTPGAPPELLSLVNSMWAQEPQSRPSAQQVLDAFQHPHFSHAISTMHTLCTNIILSHSSAGVRPSSSSSSGRQQRPSSSTSQPTFLGRGERDRLLYSSAINNLDTSESSSSTPISSSKWSTKQQ